MKAYFQSEEGANLLEYCLLLALIALVTIASVRTFGDNRNNKFSYIAEKIAGHPS